MRLLFLAEWFLLAWLAFKILVCCGLGFDLGDLFLLLTLGGLILDLWIVFGWFVLFWVVG